MTETLEKRMKNNSLLMWVTLILIIVIQYLSWFYIRTPMTTQVIALQNQELLKKVLAGQRKILTEISTTKE